MSSLVDSAHQGTSPHQNVGGGRRSIKLFDAALFALFLFDRMPVLGMPGGVGLTALIGGLAIFRRPKLTNRAVAPVALGYFLMLAYTVIVSEAADKDWHQRALHLVIVFVLIWALGTGRFDFRSAVAGLVAALTLNIGAFYLGFTPNLYPPFLTGWFGDKNVAGMWYATLGILGLLLLRTGRGRFLWLLVAGVPVFLTGSRTSLSAYLIAVIWYLLRNRIPWVLRVGLVGVIVYALHFVEDNFARVAVWSDRDGTDWFRAQLDVATELKVAATPWYGQGLTEAWVWYSPTRRIWFHDSYAALYVEGGVIMAVVIVGLYAVVAGGILRLAPVPREVVIVEASVAVIMVCAWKLGEVFLTSAGFLVLGAAIAYRYGRPREPAAPLIQ